MEPAEHCSSPCAFLLPSHPRSYGHYATLWSWGRGPAGRPGPAPVPGVDTPDPAPPSPVATPLGSHTRSAALRGVAKY
eukprot:5737189-Prymnesium_polylepis.1